MAQAVLSRSQRNDILDMIRRHTLDPVDFRWSEKTEREEVTEILAHPSTGAYFEFGLWQHGGFWLAWWPSLSLSRQHTSAKNWLVALEIVSGWLNAVRADHEAPDLWGELAKERVIPAAAHSTEYEEKFSSAELTQLEAALADIERFIAATQPLDPPAKQQVQQRFAYLLDAARQGTRKVDWLNIFVGVIVGMVMEGLLNAAVYAPVMKHAMTVLNAVFQFGVKLLN